MTRTDREFDDYGKRVLAPLRQDRNLDPQSAAETKKRFLMQADSLRQGLISQPETGNKQNRPGKTDVFRIFQRNPGLKALMAVVLAAFIILSGSSITVAAAQSSLPGEPLYAIKSWSEDVRLSMTHSTEAKLNLTLDYTNRRLDEISGLLAGGKALSDQSSDRFQEELENALQLAAQLDDTQMQDALGQIKKHAEYQGMTIEELIDKLPPQAEPAIVRLQARLAEQIQLSNFGESDPQSFRAHIRERQQKQQDSKHSSGTDQPESILPGMTVTPIPKQEDGENKKTHQPTDMPGQGDPGNGKGQNTPGNGNHESNESSTQEP